VRRICITLAVLLTCSGASQVSAQSEPTWEDFQAVDRIGTGWAYAAFLQRYPTGQYADLAIERITRLGGFSPGVDFSRARAAITGVPGVTPSRRIREPNYGDAYFMRRHLPLQRW
jgi:hypothetical protein